MNALAKNTDQPIALTLPPCPGTHLLYIAEQVRSEWVFGSDGHTYGERLLDALEPDGYHCTAKAPQHSIAPTLPCRT